MSNTIKQILTLLLAVMMVVSFTACGGSSNPASDIDADATQTGTDGGDETGDETEIEGRTAIIFKTICEDGASVCVVRDEQNLESYEGMRLMADDSIICGTGAQCYIRIDDDKNILLDADTIMTVEELSDGAIRLKLVGGQFFCDVQNKLLDEESMEFDVGGTTMSIRGTSLSGTLELTGLEEFKTELLTEATSQNEKNNQNVVILPDGTEIKLNSQAFQGKNEAQVFDGAVALVADSGENRVIVSGQAMELPNTQGDEIKWAEPTLAEPIEIMTSYIEETPSYQDKLQSVGWEFDGGSVTISQETVAKNIEKAAAEYNLETDDEGNLQVDAESAAKIASKGSPDGKDSVKDGDTKDNKEKTKDDSTIIESTDKKGEKSLEQKQEEKQIVTGACGKHSGEEGKFDTSAHLKLPCGHYACEDGDHQKLACGHYGCEKGNHMILPCGEHYACRVKDASAHAKCEHCGEGLCNGKDHTTVLACGHYACQVSDVTAHDKCAYCGGYLCDGKDHTTVLGCGHHACESGNHTLGVCGYHYVCQAGYSASAHSNGACGYLDGKAYIPETATVKLACGHTVEAGQEAGHAKCTHCGGYICDGKNHTSKSACGHYLCEIGTNTDAHKQLACGEHYVCRVGSATATHITKCTHCDEYLCDGKNHASQSDCGHYLCEIGTNTDAHKLLACGHYACEAGTHTRLSCGCYECKLATSTDHPETHKIYPCSKHCNWGSPSDVGPVIETDNGRTGPHDLLDCGKHYRCETDQSSLASHTNYNQNTGIYECGGLGICAVCKEMESPENPYGLRVPAVQICGLAGTPVSLCEAHYTGHNHTYATCTNCGSTGCACYHFSSCSNCGNYYCNSCYSASMTNCSSCGRQYCQNCIAKCATCGNYYCTSCTGAHESASHTSYPGPTGKCASCRTADASTQCAFCTDSFCEECYAKHCVEVHGFCPLCGTATNLTGHVYDCGTHCANHTINGYNHVKCSICGKWDCKELQTFIKCATCSNYFCQTNANDKCIEKHQREQQH